MVRLLPLSSSPFRLGWPVFIAGVLMGLLTGGCDVLGLGDDASGPRLETVPGKIVFAAEREGEDDGNIYVIDQEGTRQLTDFGTDAFAVNPSFSPEGRQIAFSACEECTTLGPSLYLMDSDGSNRRLFKRYPSGVPEGMVGWNPAWSPSGDRLAYSRCMNCEAGGSNYEVFVAEVKGRTFDPEDETRIMTHPATDGGAAWSPNGQELVFTSNRPYIRGDSSQLLSDLYIAEADGTDESRRLTNTGYVGTPTWSPNGEVILCGMNREENKGDLLLMDPDDGSTSIIETDLRGSFTIIPGNLSPDGNDLLLMATSSQESRIYALNMESKEARRITVPESLLRYRVLSTGS